MSESKLGKRDALRAVVAGSRAVALRSAARALFEAGGKRVLPAAVQRVVKNTVEREASRVLSAVGVADRVLEGRAVTAAAAGGARSVAVVGARQAGRQVMRTVAGAAGAGALVDGGFAIAEVVGPVSRGEVTREAAMAHVAREAGTGAVATAAGTVAASLLVAMTGGIAAPAVFVVAAAAALGAKAGLDAWLGPSTAAQEAGSYPRLGPSQRSTSATVLPFRRA